MSETTREFTVLIVGGGAAGISVAARLCKQLPPGAVGIVDPSAKHHYQPLWTLVGGGVCAKEVTERDEASVIPDGAVWLQDGAETFDPDAHRVVLRSGAVVHYEKLVVCPGIQLDWSKIAGLEGNVGKHGICSNYAYETVQDTWPTIQATEGGRALFTHPSTPIKCGGAPQKIMYLAEEAFRRAGKREGIDVHFYSGMPESFTVPHYAKVLDRCMEERAIEPHYRRDLVAVDAEARRATFACPDRDGETETVDYAMLHVTPPMSAPDFIQRSPLAGAAGWIDVDRETCQHTRFVDVFALGDASNLPTSKTGAAIRKQAPVVAENVLAALKAGPLTARYDGYTSCPLVTGYGKLVLAEFDYDKNLAETFWFDQSKERWSMYQLKRHVLPALYWQGMLKGRA